MILFHLAHPNDFAHLWLFLYCLTRIWRVECHSEVFCISIFCQRASQKLGKHRVFSTWSNLVLIIFFPHTLAFVHFILLPKNVQHCLVFICISTFNCCHTCFPHVINHFHHFLSLSITVYTKWFFLYWITVLTLSLEIDMEQMFQCRG